jgi:glycosyltransferase involved in cell wall biosynthesis
MYEMSSRTSSIMKTSSPAAPRYSVVIPVYNRPQEVDELLQSLTLQTVRNFEVIIVEDGSTTRSDSVVEKFSGDFPIQYFFKPNSGPGPSRNFGFQHARGDYFVVFDSDCIIPENYFQAVDRALAEHHWDAWGGPDRAHHNFTTLQRAMGYTMASVLTTGGIRGGKKHLGWFQPRSFNMGISRKVFESTGGFRFARYAEDIEFSIRMRESAFRVGLIPEAFVYHKRRTDFSQFYTQVQNFGKGRAQVGKAFPHEVKITHWFPAFFVMGVFILLLSLFFSASLFFLGLSVLTIYFVAIFFHSYKVNKNLDVALLSIPSAWLQLWGYGIGFLKEWFRLRFSK